MKEYFVWLAKLVTIIVLLFIVIPSIIGGLMMASKEVVGTQPFDKNVVAVVEMTGVIEESKDVIEELYKQANDKKVEGIVLRVDSPGGAVAPSQDVYSAVMRLKDRKPIVASMGSLAASGGFYSAIGASKVLAQPGTMTGSIGVILQIPNFTSLIHTVGVDVVTIKSGKLKDAGNTFRPMTEEERAYLEKTATTVHEQFIEDIAKARNVPLEKVREFADGRILLGNEAKALGMIDGYGDIYDAARLVFELKGKTLQPGENPTLIYPNDKLKEFKKIFNTLALLPKFLNRHTEIRYEMR